MKTFAIFLLTAFTALLLSSELQLSLPVLGVGPDLIAIAVVAFAAGERPMTAVLYGFAAGLLRDLLLVSPAGVSALAYAVMAYGIALAGPVRGVWALMALVGGGTFVAQVLYGLGTALLSPAAPVGILPRVAVAATVYNMLLTPLLLPALRRFALGQETPERSAT